MLKTINQKDNQHSPLLLAKLHENDKKALQKKTNTCSQNTSLADIPYKTLHSHVQMASITKCYSLPSTNTSTRHIQKISQFSNIAFQYQKTHRDTWSAEKFCETAASKNNVKRQFGPKTECSLRL